MFKKKGSKWFGLLLVCSTMFGLSLNVSLDANALKHDVQYIPISSDGALTGGTSAGPNENLPFMISWSSLESNSVGDFSRNQLHYFSSRISNSKCTFVNYDDFYRTEPSIYSTIATQFNFGFPSYRFIYGNNSYDSRYLMAPCMQTSQFGTLLSSSSNINQHPNFDDSSLVNIPIADRPPYLDLLPYYYDFDSFYLHDSAIDTNTGIRYNNSLKLSSILGFAPTRFNRLRIPLGKLNESVTGVASQGRNFSLSGVFDFSGEGNYFNWNPDLDSTSYFRLYYSGLTQSDSSGDAGSNHGGYADCTTNFVSLPANNFYQLQYECSFDSPVTFYDGQLWFYLEFSSGQQSYLFDTNANWSFGSTWFITDHDDTPGGTWGYAPTGNHLDSAPGSAQSLIPSNDDFSSSLINLFTFGFFNPFAPIFQMFSDNNSCASIPNLSSLIHSEETQVCPWFNSTIRNIVTPVLGLSSMMLVFGFAVRWLGSRSGNFIEDSGGIDSGGYHFENKFRRKN